MTPDYIHTAPKEALDALHKYHEALHRRVSDEVDWMCYPYIFEIAHPHYMDFSDLEKQLQKLEGKETNE